MPLGEDITPYATSLLRSNRNLGYLIEEAISDLIDNSITAEAKSIYINLKWNNQIPTLSISDNGFGMTLNKLVESFRLGSNSEIRESNDLGRFGLGMKTASLSQAKRLVVLTKRNNEKIIGRALDLEYIEQINNRWNLEIIDIENYSEECRILEESNQGTVIIWGNWDRAPKNEEDFISISNNVINYLSVCFHRYIDKYLKIFFNDFEVPSVSPIPPNSEVKSRTPFSESNDTVQNAYLLQHPKYWDNDFINSRVFNSYTLFNGFEAQQGLYIYRCDRLITPKGGWFELIKQSNSSKLARITIDYPNKSDKIWNTDVTKTSPSIPYEFKKEIENLISTIKSASIIKINKGYRKQGDEIRSNYKNSQIWKEEIDNNHNCFRYKIDLNHMIFKYLEEESIIDHKNLVKIIRLIEDNLPISKIIENNELKPSYHDRMIRSEKLSNENLEIAKNIFDIMKTKMPTHECLEQLFLSEPFCYYQDQLKSFLNEH